MSKVRDIDHISPSQLILYENCPNLWYLRYIEGYWPPKSHPLKFGIAFHDGMEYLMRDWGRDVAVSNALSRFSDAYIFQQNGEDSEKWVRKAKEMYQHLSIGLSNFESFEPISSEQTLQREKLRGRIDCFAKINGEDYLIDWKTTSRPYDEEMIETSLQLTAYCWLTENKYKPAFILATKYSTDFYFFPTERTNRELLEFEDYMNSVIWQMENRKHFPKNTEFCSSYSGCTAMKDGLCEGRNDF